MRSKVFYQVLATCTALICLPGYSQITAVEYPTVGQPIPDFRLTDVHYYIKNVFEPRDIQSRWLILDFWNTGCTVCVKSFPKINQLQNEFKKDIQFLLIGQNDQKYNKNIKQNFARYTKNLGLNLSIAYDTTLFKKFAVYTVPHIIIIDPQGLVYAITHSKALNQEILRDLIDNKRPSFIEKSDAIGAKRPNRWSYLSNDESGEHDFLYQSVLSFYKGETLEGAEFIDQYAKKGFFKVTGVPVSYLFKFAWFGQASWVDWDTLYPTHSETVIMEISNQSLLKLADGEASAPEKLYNYYTAIPRDQVTRKRLMDTMQSDLEKYFGVTATIETRSMPCWFLTAIPEAQKKLTSKTMHSKVEIGPTGIKGQNLPIQMLVSQIRRYNTDRIPIFDQTEIRKPIDIELSAAMIDTNDVQKALKKYGLTLEKGMKEMKVLVIHDRNSSP